LRLWRALHNRRNWLFCGNAEGGRRAAVMYTLIESCKAARVEPFAYLTDLFERLPTATASQIADFTPRNWAAARGR
jgi:transposase